MTDGRRSVKLPRGKPRALLLRPERIRTPGIHTLSGRVDIAGPEGGAGGVRLSVLVNGEPVVAREAWGPRALSAGGSVTCRRGDYVELVAVLVPKLPDVADTWPVWLRELGMPLLGKCAPWRVVDPRLWVRRVG